MALFHPNHPIPHPHVGLYVLWMGRVRLDLFAQRSHKHPQGGHVPLPGAAPDLFGDEGVGQDFAHVAGQEAEEFILEGGQVQFVSVQGGAARGEIDGEAAIGENCAFHFCGGGEILEAAQGGAQPGGQFLHGEGFG